MELVTIKESHYTTDPSVLKSKLESEGIRCFVKDEYSTDVLNHLPYVSAKLQVEKSDLPKVKSVLGIQGTELLKSKTLICPACKSLEVFASTSYRDKVAFMLRYFVSQLTASDLNDIKRNYVCNKCNNHFVF